MGNTCFVIGLVILVLAVFFAWKNRNDTSKWIFCIMIGIFFFTFFMILPTEWIKEGGEPSEPILYTLFSSLIYSFKTLSGGQDVLQVETMPLKSLVKTIYICVIYLTFLAAPILASSLLLSFFGDMGGRIQYFLRIMPKSKCYVFSEINENSLALARGIKNSAGRKTLVFCNTKKTDKDLLAQAKALGAILLYKSCRDVKISRRFSKYEFNLISPNEDNNIELAEAIIAENYKEKRYVFFGINEKFLEYAEEIKSRYASADLIFCNEKKADKELLEKAKYLGTVWRYKFFGYVITKCLSLKYEMYSIFISENSEKNENNEDSENSENSGNNEKNENNEEKKKIKSKSIPEDNGKITINAFVESGANAKFLESIARPRTIELRCIDEIALFCNSLIYEHPLYRTKQHGNHISVAIIGCGRTGMRMLKTVYWAGQIDGYTLKIRVYDKNADRARESFYRQCPGLKEEAVIQFVNADAETCDLKEKLLEKDNSPDATYIVVAMGDDQLNFSLGDELYRIYRRNSFFEDEKMPEIFVRVRSNSKTQSYFKNIGFLTERHIHLFGTAESIFSEKTLFNTDLENLAFAVHLVYWKRLFLEKHLDEYKEVYLSFKTDEYSRRSSMAAALHIPAKLLMCDENAKNITDIFSEEARKVIDNYNERIKDTKETERMARNEHERWKAFTLSEGYQLPSKEEMLQYSKTSHDHKDLLSMLHPCITDWDSLDDLAETYNRVHGKDKDGNYKNFKEYDELIVQRIPEIIKKAREMKGEN